MLKRQFADRLANDCDGRGRLESAAYKVCESAYLHGVSDGLKAAGLEDAEIKLIISIVG